MASSRLVNGWERAVSWITHSWRPIVVGVATVLAFIATWTSRGRELGYVLKYVIPLAITFLAANWSAALLDFGLAVLWLSPFAWWAKRPWLLVARQVVVFGNRQFQYVDAILPWIVAAAALGWAPQDSRFVLPILVFFCTSAALLSPRLWQALARRLLRGARISPAGTDHDALWKRRPFQLAFGVLGLFVVAASAPGQAFELFRLFFFVILAAIARFVHWRIEYERPAAPTTTEDGHERTAARAREAFWAKRLDWLVGALAAALVLNHFIPPLFGQREVRDVECRRLLLDGCLAVRPESIPSDVALFIVSDTQFHELDGPGSGANLDLVDSFVSVAVRPVELQLLEGATLAAFAARYRDLKKAYPQLKWAHLGDIGDLGCTREFDRFESFLPHFEDKPVALVPGNHDSTYLGNFSWHPEWTNGCGGNARRLTKAESDRRLLEMMGTGREPLRHRATGWGSIQRTAVATVALLGTTPAGKKVGGVFFDTSDYANLTTLGAAGVEGTVTSEQIEDVVATLKSSGLTNASLVLFLHHPFDALDGGSRARLRDFIRDRSDDVAAIVSAHTHLAAPRWQTVGAREIPEMVVGSTIDPPQEASLLRVRDSGAGVSVSVETLPVVEREGAVCSPGGARYRAQDCAEALAPLKEVGECKTLFEDWRRLRERDTGVVHPQTPAEAEAEQSARARRLIGCICRGKPCAGRSDAPLADETVRAIDALSPRSGPKNAELVCISWAASTMQGHKSEQWDLDRALRSGFDSAAAPSALDLPGPRNRCR